MGKLIDINDTISRKFFELKRNRLMKKNQNWLGLVCGGTGTGKSFSSMVMAKLISPNKFSIDNVVFSPLDFLKKIQNIKGLKKGDILVFDEAGVGMSSREWYSIQNKLLGSVLQTFRNLNIGVIFTTPSISFIDSNARKLFHNYFETIRIDFEKKLVFLKVYDIQHNSRYDKTYYKHPRINVRNKIFEMPNLALPEIDEQLKKEYEKKKQLFTIELNKNAYEELTKTKRTGLREKTNFEEEKKIIVDIKKNSNHYLNRIGKIDADLIRSDYNLSQEQSKRLKKCVDKELFDVSYV